MLNEVHVNGDWVHGTSKIMIEIVPLLNYNSTIA